MDEDELPKVGCKPDRPVKGAAHKMVTVEESRKMLLGLSIGAHEAADAECGAEAECADVVPKDADYSKFLDQEIVLGDLDDSWQHYNGKPPQNENRSATGACTSYAAAGTVTAALMQTRAVVEGKVAMFKHTPSEVSATVRKKVTNEVMWMVHRQLRQWHREAGGVSIIDNETLVADCDSYGDDQYFCKVDQTDDW